MPLSPIKQALRRDRLNGGPNPGRLPKGLIKRRCDNCPKMYLKTRSNKRFCCNDCKNEFNRNGGTAYAQLKPKLEKLVRQLTGDLEGRLRAMESGLEKLNLAITALVEGQPPR